MSYKNIDLLVRELLRELEYVVIPGFGAFVCTTVPSRTLNDNTTLIPPHRLISFNRSLQRNDGIIAHKLAALNSYSIETAKTELERYVKFINRSLEKDRTFKFSDIGTFYLKDEGRIVFSPTDVKIQPLEYYGLMPIEINKVQVSVVNEVDSKQEVQENQSIKTHIDKKKEKRNKRKAEKSNRKYALALIIAALVLLSQLILWDIHPKGLELTSLNIISFNPIENIIPSDNDKDIIKPDFEVKKYVPLTKISNQNIEEGYYIVLGAFSKKHFAERLVKKLKNNNFNAHILQADNGLMRVTVYVGQLQEQATDNLTFFKSSWNNKAWLLQNNI